MLRDIHPNLTIVPIDDAKLINSIYNHPDIADRVLHDNINTFYIKHKEVSYMAAYVGSELAGIFMLINKCGIDVDIHIAILKKHVKYIRTLCRMCIDKTFERGYARITVTATDYARKMVNLALKLGFTLEGRKRSAILYKGTLYDIYILGLTRVDWGLLWVT